jgi:hypothetical protein
MGNIIMEGLVESTNGKGNVTSLIKQQARTIFLDPTQMMKGGT